MYIFIAQREECTGLMERGNLFLINNKYSFPNLLKEKNMKETNFEVTFCKTQRTDCLNKWKEPQKWLSIPFQEAKCRDNLKN